MQTVNFDEVVEKIVTQDPRYHHDAYHFVKDALDYTQKRVRKAGANPADKANRHVTGQQLLEGIRDYGLQNFGPMTKHVFEEWGIRLCEDFGDIVFNLVEHGNGMFGKTEEDSRNDFKGGYDFDEAFLKPFRPAAKTSPAEPQPKSTEA
ncbi:MAG: hypothetical protein HYZ36_08115 [Pedosphaera parvula]|nr:hypothetical protein [Pedosphaera parvula]